MFLDDSNVLVRPVRAQSFSTLSNVPRILSCPKRSRSSWHGSLTSLVASAGMATMYVRYKQVEALGGEEDLCLWRLNVIGLGLGFISSFGMCVVANFQVRPAATSPAQEPLQSSAAVVCRQSRRPRCSPCTWWGRC